MKTCPTCKTLYPAEFTVCPKDGVGLRLATDLSEGSILRGKYKILEKIGEGGMGVVYKAWHQHFEEVCALKVVSGHVAADAGFLQRFRNEALLMRRLNHPHAVRVHDFDETEDGRPFMAMEFVEGKSLAELAVTGALDPGRCVRIGAQVCQALGAAHQLGIIHRDIKPANILVTTAAGGGDTAKVADFGVAKATEESRMSASLTGTGLVVGTPDYMSPEQAKGLRGDQLDGRSDLYSLGVVLFEVLTGRRPFTGDTPMMVLLAHLHTQPPDPRTIHAGLPEPLARVVLRALEKEPARRFSTAEEMCFALEEVTRLFEIDLKGTVRWAGSRPPRVEPTTEDVVAPGKLPAAAPTRPGVQAQQQPAFAPRKAPERAPVAGRPKWLYALTAVTAVVVLLAAVRLVRERFSGPPAIAQETQAGVEPRPAESVPAAAVREPPAPEKQIAPEPVPSKPPEPKQAAPVAQVTSPSAAAPKVSTPQPPAWPPPKLPPQSPQTTPQPAPSTEPKRETAVAASSAAATPAATVSESPRTLAEQQRVDDLKTHFEAGRAALDQAATLRTELRRASTSQRAPLQQQLNQAEQSAIQSLQRAERAAPAPNPSRPLVLGNLAQAYESSGRYAEAASAYQEAARLVPGEARYVLGLGTSLARAGRFRETETVCTRAEQSGPNVGGTCWRNLGIVHYNAMRAEDAIAPLRRSTQLDPTQPDGWFLLGITALTATEFTRRGTTIAPAFPREAEEALRRYLQLAPSGAFATNVRGALERMQALRAGIETRWEAPAPPSLKRTENVRVRAGADVPTPRAVEQPPPSYPPLARLTRVQGMVQLEAVIAKDGSMLAAEVKSGHPLLYPAALDAVRKWRYPPTLVNGQPVEVITAIDLNFRLN